MDILPRRRAAEAAEQHGWTYVRGRLVTAVAAVSLRDSAALARLAVDACAGPEAHLRLDLRPRSLRLSLQTPGLEAVTAVDVDLARRISGALEGAGRRPSPLRADARATQVLELAIDTLDIAAIRPFWRAVLGYADAADPATTMLVDPYGEGPALWFQQMDEPRPQRNRIHLDVNVPGGEADQRREEALAAGGRLLASHSPSYWVLADAEGNEVCVTTWQGRDPDE